MSYFLGAILCLIYKLVELWHDLLGIAGESLVMGKPYRELIVPVPLLRLVCSQLISILHLEVVKRGITTVGGRVEGRGVMGRHW